MNSSSSSVQASFAVSSESILLSLPALVALVSIAAGGRPIGTRQCGTRRVGAKDELLEAPEAHMRQRAASSLCSALERHACASGGTLTLPSR